MVSIAVIRFSLLFLIVEQFNPSDSSKYVSRVFKGQPAATGQFPWIAFLRVFPRSGEFYTQCGGTLIDDRHILTAAHCLYVDEHTTAELKDIYTHLNITREPWPMRNANPAEAYFIHPEFNITQDWIMGHDIAIIRLKTPVTMKPLCIYTPTDFNDNQELITAGFGHLDDEDNDSNTNLHYVIVNYLNRNECESNRKDFVDEQLQNGKMKSDQVPILLENQICAINKATRGDTCGGDSGGPLIDSSTEEGSLVGVITGSWTECGSSKVPGIYTVASKYLDWIKSKGANPCLVK